MSIPAIEIISHGINCTRSVINLLRTSQDLLSDDKTSPLIKALVIGTKTLGVACTAYETNAVLHNASTDELMTLKSYELMEKTLEMGTLVPVWISRFKDPSDKKIKRPLDCFIDVCSSASDFARITSEMQILEERHYLEMTPEERASTKRYYYYEDGIIEKPIDVDECKEMIASCENVELGASLANLILESEPMRDFINSIGHRQNQQAQRVQPRNAPLNTIRPQRHNVERPLRLTHLLEEKKRENVEDLLSLSYIPSQFYENDPDSIFLKFECNISMLPARRPVQDPTATGSRRVIYDEMNILLYLDLLAKQGREGRSPFTQMPLRAEDLIPMQAAQRLIDTKLSSFQNTWSSILQLHPELKGLPQEAENQGIIDAARDEIGDEYFNQTPG